jgi:predicted ATP-grasp superfamily ATP-dependent carboligase
MALFKVVYRKFMLNSNSVPEAISKRLLKRRLFYVCRDIERAIGLNLSQPNYYIISNYSEFSAKLAQQHSNIILIKEKEQLDTGELLAHSQTKNIIKKDDFVLVFKNNALIEAQCKKNNWKLLNPDPKLADKVESKISQVKWLGSLAKYLPPHKIDVCGNIQWTSKPFILQFNHSHTGSGTFFIDSEKKLNDLKSKFAKRDVRITDFVRGPVFTNNNAVWGNKILTGNISYQITGLPPFTDNKFATIGNDWALPHKILSKKQILEYKRIATEIGKKLKKDGWKGLYGVDIIVDEKSKQVYLLEINARQPASTTCESLLQKLNKKLDISTFEAHLAGLLGVKPGKYKLAEIFDGAQIVQRVIEKSDNTQAAKIKSTDLINVVKYSNTAPGSDLIRWQFSKGLMKEHNVLKV